MTPQGCSLAAAISFLFWVSGGMSTEGQQRREILIHRSFLLARLCCSSLEVLSGSPHPSASTSWASASLCMNVYGSLMCRVHMDLM